MFSLIITLISIVLVAALALATLYYGGTSWMRGNAAASAATLTNQGEQVRAALTLYYTHNGEYPATLAELVTQEYLRTVPAPPSMAIAEPNALAPAWAANESWEMLAPRHPAFMVKEAVTLAVCQELNYHARGSDAIYSKVDGRLAAQCFGPVDGPFTYVVTAAGAGGYTLETAVLAHNNANGTDWPVQHPLDDSDVSVPETRNRSNAGSAGEDEEDEGGSGGEGEDESGEGDDETPRDTAAGILNVVDRAPGWVWEAGEGRTFTLSVDVSAAAGPVFIQSVSVAGANSVSPDCNGVPLEGASSCRIAIEMPAPEGGTFYAELSFTLDDNSVVVKPLPYVLWAENPLTYEMPQTLPVLESSTVNVSSTGVLVRNTADRAVTLAEVSFELRTPGGAPFGGLSLASTGADTCRVGMTLAPNGTCQLRVVNDGSAARSDGNLPAWPEAVDSKLRIRADGHQLEQFYFTAVMLDASKTLPYTILNPEEPRMYSWADVVANDLRMEDALVVHNTSAQATTFVLSALGGLQASTATSGCQVLPAGSQAVVTVNAGVTCTIDWSEQMDAARKEFLLDLRATTRFQNDNLEGDKAVQYAPIL